MYLLRKCAREFLWVCVHVCSIPYRDFKKYHNLIQTKIRMGMHTGFRKKATKNSFFLKKIPSHGQNTKRNTYNEIFFTGSICLFNSHRTFPMPKHGLFFFPSGDLADAVGLHLPAFLTTGYVGLGQWELQSNGIQINPPPNFS